ncbi:MAG: hypothetical protein AAFU03_14105, partial [Bacteroidota bacterium]
ADIVVEIKAFQETLNAETIGGNTQDLSQIVMRGGKVKGPNDTVGRKRYFLEEGKIVKELIDDYSNHPNSSPYAIMHVISRDEAYGYFKRQERQRHEQIIDEFIQQFKNTFYEGKNFIEDLLDKGEKLFLPYWDDFKKMLGFSS